MTARAGIPGSRPLRVFLSYATADGEPARKLRKTLSLLPKVRLFAEDDLSAGEGWEARLKRELSECDVFMVLISPNSLASGWVSQELGAAWGLNKPILPIVLHPQLASRMPGALSGLPSLTLTEFDDPETLDKILERYEASASSGGDRG